MKAQTIFVVNHASAFMDPWVVAELQNPVLFFLTRGDIFKSWLRPITWAAHMIPIFRIRENGADSSEKNEAIFKEVYKLLKRKKSIMIFGEGYTDDVFIRSLKPLKKGPARIGFGAMVATNWEQDIKIQCTGINYSDPDKFRSDVLVSNSDIIHLKDYKEEYLENPARTISELTREIAKRLKAQLTYLEDAGLTPLHNNIQSLTKKGIAFRNSDSSIPLKQRWLYSQNLAHYLNSNYSKENPDWNELETESGQYFKELNKKGVEDDAVVYYQKNEKIVNPVNYLLLILGLPVFILGCVHHLLPYVGLKRFIEKTFKRRVFWSGIKMILGFFILSVYNIILMLTINSIFDLVNNWILWSYIILIVPFLGLLAYEYARMYRNMRNNRRATKANFDRWVDSRKQLVNMVEQQVRL